MDSMFPEVSIIMPTYNRADTIMRAIDSVIKQTFQEWELIVIDDGSTDSTSQLVIGIDPRIQVIRQDNHGVAASRNRGLLASKGRFISFLDSDDEWLSHYLELAIGFMKAFPDEHFVTLEFLYEDTDQRMIKSSIGYSYLPVARMVGSNTLDLPPNESDDYMRIYQSRQPLGTLGAKVLSDAIVSESFLYQGRIFHQTRWGYLGWLPTTVLTRHALEVVGNFDSGGRGAECYHFLALLFRNFRTNFISVPSARKHERGLNSAPVKQEHLALGPNYCTLRINRLHYFDQLHWLDNQHDRELSLIRKQYVYKTACVAMHLGLRKEALKLFKEASGFQSYYWRSYFLCLLVYLYVPTRVKSKVFRYLCRRMGVYQWVTDV